jgi:TRAP-type C4-dicarboxylate transport system permease small subunit
LPSSGPPFNEMSLFLIFSSFNRTIARACLWFSGIGLVLMTVVIGWQVFARYILNDTPHWSERFCLLLMIYFILFAAAAGVRDGTHIGLVVVKQRLPDIPRKIVQVTSCFIVLAFGVGMVWYGTDMVRSTWTHVIPTLGVPTGVSYLPFPLAGGLFILFSLEHILSIVFGWKER